MPEIDPKRSQGRNEPSFVRLDPFIQSRMQALFVPPAHFPKEPADNLERIFLIHGKPEAGKLIAAINFAGKLAKLDNPTSPLTIATYQHQGLELYDLNSLITSSAFKENCVYIVPNVFRYGLPSSALDAQSISAYRKELSKLNAYIILTAATDDFPNDGSLSLPTYLVDGVDLPQVLEKHLKYYYKDVDDDVIAQLLATKPLVGASNEPPEQAEQFGENAPEIELSDADSTEQGDEVVDAEVLKLLEGRKLLAKELKSLDSPKKIGRLFSDLRHSPIQAGQELQSIIEVIHRITRTDSTSLRRWFRELNLNTKVFAMLVAILLDNKYELNLFDAEEIYYSLVQRARQKRGMDGEAIFIDPRRIGLDDIVANANMSSWNNILSFNIEAQRRIILDYEVANYHGLLWLLAELLIEQLEPAPRRYARNPAIPQYIGHPDLPLLSFSNAEQILANLVGYIGIYRSDKLEKLLGKLSASPYSDLLGELLKPLARASQYHEFILHTIEAWLYPKNQDGKASKAYQPNDFVAAAYTLPEIYPVMLQTLSAKPDERTRIRKLLFDFIHRMAEICGSYEQYIDNFELESLAALEAQFQAAEASGKAQSENEKEKDSASLDIFVHQHLLNISEGSTIVLLYLIRAIATNYPEDMVEIIETWLLRGVEQREQETDQEDDSEIERLLAVDDVIAIGETQGTIAQERAAQAARARLNTMTWHIGMIAAVMFFQSNLVVNKPVEESKSEEKEDKAPEAKQPRSRREAETEDEEDEEAKSPEPSRPTLESKENTEAETEAEASADPDKQSNLLINQSDGTENLTNASLESTKATPELGVAAAVEPKKAEEKPREIRTTGLSRSDSRSNRLAIIRNQFPLLRLLPALLNSSELPFNTYSFLSNLPRSAELVAHYDKGNIYYLYDNPRDFLETEPLREAFRAIHRWYEILVGNRKDEDVEGREEWMKNVYPMLLKLFNTATQGQRLRLRNLLFSEGWVESAYEPIRHVAHALLARSFILDGRVLDMPSERYGVVLMDAGLRKYNWSAYYENAYRLIQQLLTLSPLRIYHMGAKQLIKSLGEDKQTSPLMRQELRPRRSHPRLIMPFFEEILLEPEKVHFVLVLSPISAIQSDSQSGVQADILDLADVLEMASAESRELDPKLQKILTSSMYTEAEKEVARQKIASAQNGSDWAWKQKLFLVSPVKEQIRQALNQEFIQKQVADGQIRHLRNDVEEFLTIIGVNDASFSNDLDLLEQPLALQIASTLHELKAEDWERDLKKIWGKENDKFDVLPNFNLRDADSVREQVLLWIPQLGDVSKAQHPRDISMTIIWTILGLSRFNFPAAIEIVKDYLDLELPEAIQSTELDELTEIMAVACTKTLFNFYRLSPDLYENADEYRRLLDLLPSFLQSSQGRQSSEFWQIFSILMLWARSDEWAKVFLKDGSKNPLAKAVRKIKGRQEVSDLRRLISIHECIIALARFYRQTEFYWADYHKLLLAVADWYAKTRFEDRSSKLSAFTRNFNNERISENLIMNLLDIMNQASSEISSFYGTKAGFSLFLERIGAHVATLGIQPLERLEAYEVNVKQVANLMRLQLFGGSSRLEPMPAPPEGKRYGVILFNSSTRGHKSDIRSKVIGFVKHFRKLASEKQCEKIAFTMHRIGRNEEIYKDSQQAPSQEILRLPDGTPDFAPLVSPILERYQSQHVAFVLIVSDRQPRDLDDLRDDELWLDRIFLLSRRTHSWMREFYGESNTLRTRRLKEEIEQLTEFILEFIEC